MYINYQPGANGIVYATATKSARVNGVVTKTDSVYLGRVLDRDRNIFQSRARGVFCYDVNTGEFLKPPVDFVPTVRRKNAKEPELFLDFGDAYFLDRLMVAEDFSPLIEAIDYGNPDTLKAMLMYYMATQQANCHAETWFDGNYAKVLYPKANLTSQRISDLLSTIGTEACYQRFFKKYIPYIKMVMPKPDASAGADEPVGEAEEPEVDVPDGEGILIDSTGLPNSIRFPITAVSNHNGIISEEVRLIYVVQRGSGLPIYMRYVAGNIIDSTTLLATIGELKACSIDTKFAILDAGYVTEENVRELKRAKIPFVARLPENRKVYKAVKQEHAGALEQPENLVMYGDRILYVKRVRTEIVDGVTGYIYLGLDVAQKQLLQSQLARRVKAKEITVDALRKQMPTLGLFCLVSSRKVAVEKILPLYYSRQDIEQVFDLSKNYASMLPLSVQTEETFRGHLLVTFLATVLMRKIQQKGLEFGWDLSTLFSHLRNQKCKVFPDVIIPQEITKKQRRIYNDFGIKPPASLAHRPSRL